MRLLRKKLLREILESKFRFFAISSVVAIGILLFTASYMSFLNLSKSYQYTYDRLNFEDLLVRVDRAPERVVERLSALPNIELMTPRVNDPLGMELEDGTRITGQVIGVPDEEPYVNMLYVREGSAITGQEQGLTCLVENHFATFNDLHEGDIIYAVKNGERMPINIAGVVSSPEYMVVFRNRQFPMTSATVYGVFYFNMDQARALTGFASNSFNEFAFTLKDYSLLETTERQVREVLKPYGIEEVTNRDNQISNTLLEMDLRSFHDFALFFPILFFSIAAFSIYMILSRLVRTQRPIIGLMRAIGYSSRRVLLHYMSFALVVGLVGVVFGSLLGLAATGVVSKVYSIQMKIPFVQYGLYPLVFLYGFLMAMAFCAISGIVPARRSAKIQPTEALRGVVDPIKYGKVSWVERLLPRIDRLRVFWRLPLRNIFRNRRRTAFTVIGIMFAIILIMLNLGINDTVNANMDQAFNHLFTFDIAVLFLDPQTRVTQNKIEKIPGVTLVEPTIGAPCTISNGDEDVDSILMGALVDTVMRGFLDEKNREVQISTNHCLMSRNYRDQLGVAVGDMVEVTSNNRSRSFMVSDFIMEPMGSFVYVPVEEARELLGYGTKSSAFYIQVDEGYYQEVRDVPLRYARGAHPGRPEPDPEGDQLLHGASLHRHRGDAGLRDHHGLLPRLQHLYHQHHGEGTGGGHHAHPGGPAVEGLTLPHPGERDDGTSGPHPRLHRRAYRHGPGHEALRDRPFRLHPRHLRVDLYHHRGHGHRAHGALGVPLAAAHPPPGPGPIHQAALTLRGRSPAARGR